MNNGIRERLALSIGPNWIGFYLRIEIESSLWNVVFNKKTGRWIMSKRSIIVPTILAWEMHIFGLASKRDPPWGILSKINIIVHGFWCVYLDTQCLTYKIEKILCSLLVKILLLTVKDWGGGEITICINKSVSYLTPLTHTRQLN
jgi:hypothetical protein